MLRRRSVVSCFIVSLVCGGCGDDAPLDSVDPAAHAQSSQHNAEDEQMPPNEQGGGEADAGENEEEIDAGPADSEDATAEDTTAEDTTAEDAAVEVDAASEADAATSMPEVGLPCDVQAFFASKCQRCHGPEAKNGTPLMNRANLMATSMRDPSMEVIERVLVRISDQEKPMPPMGKGEPASEDEIAMLKAWVEGGSVAAECAH
jgi:mono/diheme cytochrome c family protein